jgi:hypothetical protein
VKTDGLLEKLESDVCEDDPEILCDAVPDTEDVEDVDPLEEGLGPADIEDDPEILCDAVPDVEDVEDVDPLEEGLGPADIEDDPEILCDAVPDAEILALELCELLTEIDTEPVNELLEERLDCAVIDADDEPVILGDDVALGLDETLSTTVEEARTLSEAIELDEILEEADILNIPETEGDSDDEIETVELADTLPELDTDLVS